MDNKDFLFVLAFFYLIGAVSGFAIFYRPKHELTYSEKRTIAIEFACHEKWKGMKGFCGNLPPADRKDEK